jgi:hypothetical protein
MTWTAVSPRRPVEVRQDNDVWSVGTLEGWLRDGDRWMGYACWHDPRGDCHVGLVDADHVRPVEN